MNTIQTALGNYKPNYCPSSSDAERARESQAIKEATMTQIKKYRTIEETLPLYEEAMKLVQEKGMSQTEAAAKVGVSQGQLSHFMRSKGIRMRAKKVKRTKTSTLNAKDTIMHYHAKGWSNARIARKVKLHASTVGRVIMDAKGVPHSKSVNKSLTPTTPTNKSPILTELKRRLRDEIYEEVKAEIIREILG